MSLFKGNVQRYLDLMGLNIMMGPNFMMGPHISNLLSKGSEIRKYECVWRERGGNDKPNVLK